LINTICRNKLSARIIFTLSANGYANYAALGFSQINNDMIKLLGVISESVEK
jgi:hypothetical protein